MSARDVIEHALREYYRDSSDPRAVVNELLRMYDAEVRNEGPDDENPQVGDRIRILDHPDFEHGIILKVTDTVTVGFLAVPVGLRPSPSSSRYLYLDDEGSVWERS